MWESLKSPRQCGSLIPVWHHSIYFLRLQTKAYSTKSNLHVSQFRKAKEGLDNVFSCKVKFYSVLSLPTIEKSLTKLNKTKQSYSTSNTNSLNSVIIDIVYFYKDTVRATLGSQQIKWKATYSLHQHSFCH